MSSGKQSLPAFAEQKGVNSAGLTEGERRQAQKLVANFTEEVPENKTERRVYLLETAGSICKNSSQYERSLQPNRIERGRKDSKMAARRLSYASQVINERFTNDVPVSRFRRLRNGVDDATKYVPIVGSYNRLTNASCAASEKRTDQSLRRFQVAAIMFGVDTLLVASGGFYKPAFTGTRYVMNTASKFGLYRLRYVCGNRCWALAWSEVHWALRGEMLVRLHELAQYAATSDLNITREDYRRVAEMQGINSKAITQVGEKWFDEGKQISGNVGKKAQDCLSNVSDDPEKAGKEAKDQAEDVVSGVFGGKKESQEESNPCNGR